MVRAFRGTAGSLAGVGDFITGGRIGPLRRFREGAQRERAEQREREAADPGLWRGLEPERKTE